MERPAQLAVLPDVPEIDRHVLAKLRQRHAPHLLTGAERAALEHWARRRLGRWHQEAMACCQAASSILSLHVMRLTILQYITPSRIGGAETYFLRLVDSLRAAGHRVLVVTKRDTPLRRELDGRDVELYPWVTHGKLDPLTLWKLCRLIRREKVDVINTHLTTASFLGSLAGRLMGVPVVARVPATEHKTFFQLAHYLIAVSEGVKQHLVAQGVRAEKIHVLYNGIDLDRYAHPLPSAEAKARLGLPANARTVGIVASLTERKGHRFLLHALKRIEPQVGEVHALFAGEGDQEDALRRLAASLGLSERVHFLGFRQDVVEVVSACDAFVLPSLKEGLSNAVMEAMALRRPVIVTNIAGMPELVRDGETGLLVPPADVGALADALRRVLSDAAFAERLARNGRRFLEQHFDQQARLAEVEQFFQQVVKAWRREYTVRVKEEG
ncbi:MAG: glycosyltransferase family 4 protein [Abditibacteriales bacterium]|nr:glycosyltransferase family 4 protein [Abditibacteriales bacterium]MDW8364258.1 glycosyltransferase family 4 protein [Abditibacteriales bacterium]